MKNSHSCSPFQHWALPSWAPTRMLHGQVSSLPGNNPHPLMKLELPRNRERGEKQTPWKTDPVVQKYTSLNLKRHWLYYFVQHDKPHLVGNWSFNWKQSSGRQLKGSKSTATGQILKERYVHTLGQDVYSPTSIHQRWGLPPGAIMPWVL